MQLVSSKQLTEGVLVKQSVPQTSTLNLNRNILLSWFSQTLLAQQTTQLIFWILSVSEALRCFIIIDKMFSLI